MLETIIANVGGAATRYETLEGRQYLVAPAVMLVEGVHEGNGGKGYYPSPFLATLPLSWNMKPLVAGHPQIDGQSVSACTPNIIETYGLGMLLNTSWESPLLKTEAWFDVEKTKKIAPAILEKLEKKEKIEVSTGVYIGKDDTPGEWNGTPFDWTAVDYKPDHLAILLENEGACSIKKGCGLLNNASTDMSFSDIMSAVNDALAAKFGEPGKEWYGWVQDIYDSYVVFYDKRNLYMQNYSMTKGEVTLTGNPQKVERVSVYQPVDNASVSLKTEDGRLTNNCNCKGAEMTKQEQVDFLIKNGGWGEGERDWLSSLLEGRLTTMVENVKKTPAPPPPAPAPVPAPTLVGNATPPVVAPAAPVQQPMTMEQYVNNAPPGVREFIIEGLNARELERQRLVGIITANTANRFTKEQLNTFTMEVLSGMASLAHSAQPTIPVPTPNYSGAWTPAPTVNAGGSTLDADEQAGLTIPVCNFSKN